jgi:membrane protein implicated in regulation of membrane protease activity
MGFLQKRADQFFERLADWIAEKIGVVVPTQTRQYGDVSLEGPCWQTSATAMDHL